MRWIIERRGRERGAVAVMVAISMVVMMGFAALAIDLGGAYSERQQLQNGADASALAIAQDCAAARSSCATATGTANQYVDANKLDGAYNSVTVAKGSNSVMVATTYTRTNWFAGVIGIPTTDVSAQASAQWGPVSSGSTLPLTFSLTCFSSATKGWDGSGLPNVSIEVIANIKDKVCTNPAHNEVNGGFGWLASDGCAARMNIGGWVDSQNGAAGPSSDCESFWKKLQDQTALIPLFDSFQATGSDKGYHIAGMASFTVTGYCFTKFDWNVAKCNGSASAKSDSGPRVVGKFTKWTPNGDYTIDPNGGHYGAEGVKLVS